MLNADLLDARHHLDRMGDEQRIARLLDQGELLKKPLSQIISRGSALLENSTLEAANVLRRKRGLAHLSEYSPAIIDDELALRMREIEIHLHHMLRLTHELRQAAEEERMAEQVAKLRLAAGLNAMKGGPLRPE